MPRPSSDRRGRCPVLSHTTARRSGTVNLSSIGMQKTR
jgi:hypothetical protein